jgi:eukaryotic-like serine/threonine-protein kinase
VLAYQTGMAASGSHLTWFDRAGKQLGVLGDPAAQGDVQLSPDGKQAAVSIQDPARQTSDIWIYDVARNLKTRFTFDPADELALTWSPDGKRVVFNSSRKGHLDLYQKAADGSETEALLFEDNLGKWPASWSPDGRSLYYFTLGAANNPTNNADWFVLPLTGERKPVPFIHSQFNETFLASFLRTAAGSHTPRTNLAGTKYMSCQFRGRAGSGRSRTAAEICPAGGATARSSFIWIWQHPAS